MIVLDASVVIAWTEPNHVHRAAAEQVYEADVRFRIHPVNLAEVLVGPARAGQGSVMLRHLHDLGIEPDVPGPREPVRLAQLRVETGLKMPDCCALYSAEAGAVPLATFDARLADAARRLGLVVVGPF